MKIMIWFGCILCISLVHSVLQLTIGVTSPILELVITGALAQFLCKKWDGRHSIRKKTVTNVDVTPQYQSDPIHTECSKEENNTKGERDQNPDMLESSPIINLSDNFSSNTNQNVKDSSASNDPFEALKKLKLLYDEKVINDEEYIKKKEEILKRI